MEQNEKNDPKGQPDDPSQALEEGDPQGTGRVRGHVGNELEQPDTDRANPDAPAGRNRKDASAATPHRESGDRG